MMKTPSLPNTTTSNQPFICAPGHGQTSAIVGLFILQTIFSRSAAVPPLLAFFDTQHAPIPQKNKIIDKVIRSIATTFFHYRAATPCPRADAGASKAGSSAPTMSSTTFNTFLSNLRISTCNRSISSSCIVPTRNTSKSIESLGTLVVSRWTWSSRSRLWLARAPNPRTSPYRN